MNSAVMILASIGLGVSPLQTAPTNEPVEIILTACNNPEDSLRIYLDVTESGRELGAQRAYEYLVTGRCETHHLLLDGHIYQACRQMAHEMCGQLGIATQEGEYLYIFIIPNE